MFTKLKELQNINTQKTDENERQPETKKQKVAAVTSVLKKDVLENKLI